ncbi:MAG: glycosyltransferase family 4 protein [Fimbriimonadales bacterium]|nr:glycosyltransferase family 4 protein [Fimbriimonadales bacterium]
MRVLLVHAAYRYRGGEDVAFEADDRLLREAGHEVRTIVFSNADLPRGAWQAARTAVWNPAAAAEVARVASELGAEVVHFHNTFPVVSPAAHVAAADTGAAVVQTLHNYRLGCVNALLFRKGGLCTDCVGRGPWLGAWRRCYRGSFGASLATAWMIAHHRRMDTWNRAVHQFLAVSETVRRVAVASGVQPERIRVRPNFLAEDPGVGGSERGGFLYLGRLSEEKGARVVLELWARDPTLPRLTIAGDGPLRPLAERTGRNVRVVGLVSREKALQLLKEARALVLPSLCLDAMPVTLVEAFATATPVIASNVESLASLVGDGRTGLLFDPGSAEALADAVRRMEAHPQWPRMSRNCRLEFEERFSRGPALKALEESYQLALEAARLARSPR